MTVRIGYTAALEQVPPGAATRLAALAEEHGFDGVMATDRFQPWLPVQGEASFVWSVLAAIGERTTGSIGPGATVPTFRMHPAVVAQAAATLGSLYPGRVWLGVGSGEAVNDHIVGEYWPEPAERIARMFEAIELIKKLFTASAAGRDVRHSGPAFRMESTRLWTMPASPPPIYVATSGPVTARRAGRVADGLITVAGPRDRLAAVLGRFADGAREAGRGGENLPRILQLHLSWAETDEQAWEQALTLWPNGAMPFSKSDIRSPFEFEQLARLVRREHFDDRFTVSADPDVHRAAIQRYVDLGFDQIYLHNVGRNQDEWLRVFGRDVLPKVTG